jgi:hypothetical protein
MESLEGRTLLASVGGVDTFNMGKGDWIFQVSSAEAATGSGSVAKLVDYLKARGMKWVVVKAGDGNNGPSTPTYAQFNKSLIDTVHAAGLKIFAYQYVYGGYTPNTKNAPTTQAGEKAVRDQIMALNPDGLLVDAEIEWEKNPSATSIAEDFGKTFKQNYPTKLFGLDTFAYTRFHDKFPYLAWAKYADVIVPQMYWRSIANAGTPEQIVTDVDTDWKKLYGDFAAAGHPEAVRPLVPIGQGFDVDKSTHTTGSEISRFFNLLRDDTDPASPFGYNGVGFWSVQHHTVDQWQAIANGTISAPTASISGKVFNDANADAVQQNNESGISGRIVYDDTNNNTVHDAYEGYVKTDSKGNFTLPYQPAGRQIAYQQDLPSGWRFTVPSSGFAPKVTLTPGQKVTGQVFAATQLALATGTAFNDKNGNGTRDTDELPLKGWTIFADADRDGVLDDNEIRTTTNSRGGYRLNVPAGRYLIRQLVASGYRVSSPLSGAFDVTLAAAQAVRNVFADTTLALISGSVFNDTNGDGVRSGSESALKGWRVFADLDSDGVWDATEPSSLTDSGGKYRLLLSAGRYRITVLQQSKWAATVPANGVRRVTLASGSTTSNRNFGEARIT